MFGSKKSSGALKKNSPPGCGSEEREGKRTSRLMRVESTRPQGEVSKKLHQEELKVPILGNGRERGRAGRGSGRRGAGTELGDKACNTQGHGTTCVDGENFRRKTNTEESI